MKYIILNILARINDRLPIFHFLERLSREILRAIDVRGIWTKLEGQIIEYKPRDVFDGNDDKIADELSEDIITKLKSSSCKIYILGVEDDGAINPISRSRLKSDRVENIKRKTQAKLSSTNVYALPIIQDRGGIVILIAHRI